MTPVYISGCFGVLHPAAGTRGVLICGTMGDESLNVYRPLAFLAEQFAAAGSPTLRLEYYGAGDSGGEDGEHGRFQAWLTGVAAGVRWLRETCGVGPVTLVGVRVGAVVVASAACEIDDVEALVMLSPVPSGRRFLRELILRANTIASIWQVEARIEDGQWFEAYGLRLDRPTRDMLERLDMAKLPRCPAPRALVLDGPGGSAGGAVAERLQLHRVEVTCEVANGLDAMLRDPYENAVPHEAFARVIAWHGDALAGVAGECSGTVRPAQPSLARRSPAHPSPSPLPRAEEADAVLATDYGTETPIRFGSPGGLFGILSVPAHPRDNAPPVLIANTGANPRSGNARSAVAIARWLAGNGIASLRMDGAGIGDSAIETGERGQPYASQGDHDLAAGIDELVRRFASPVLLLGMCSGAFHALRATCDDRRVAGLMLVNLQKFVWQDGESLSVMQRTTFRTTRFYLRNLITLHVWHRLVHGEINVAGITRALAGRALRRVIAAGDPALALVKKHETHVGRVRRHMRDLQRRKVPILFVLSGNDPGLDEIAEYFGAQGRRLRRQPNVMFRMLDGADHTLSAHWFRDTLLGLIALFLRERCNIAIDTGEARLLASIPIRVMSPRLEAALIRPIAPASLARGSVAIDTSGSAA
jgi:alpha-beta hydrolase superfamily lysophospholipase